jgi:two-component sensor histidine kinase
VHLTQADTVEEFKVAIEGRLQALSNAHTLLADTCWVGANLHDLVTRELAPFNTGETLRANIVGPELVLRPQSAQAIAMVLHELTTNAVKYGALSIASGRLGVEWSRGDTHLVIHWSEADGPPVEPPRRQGFGTQVFKRMIENELEGELRFEWKPEGLACEIIVPIYQIVNRY